MQLTSCNSDSDNDVVNLTQEITYIDIHEWVENPLRAQLIRAKATSLPDGFTENPI